MKAKKKESIKVRIGKGGSMSNVFFSSNEKRMVSKGTQRESEKKKHASHLFWVLDKN